MMNRIEIPQHIEELRSYSPGKSIEELKKEFNLDKIAVLWNNENNLGPSPEAMKAIESCFTNSHVYPDPSALALRIAIAQKESLTANQVVVGNGSEAILSNIFQAFLKEGDEILTSEGTFVAVYIWAKSHNIHCLKLPLKKDYSFDLEAIIKNISPKTRLIYLANPNNPTGTMIGREEFQSFMEAVPKDVLVVSDEAYYEYAADLSEDFESAIRFNYPNVISLRTFSKAYGIAAIRIGYALGPERLVEALAKVKMTFEPSNIAQAAGVGALTDKAYLEKTLDLNRRGIQLFYDVFDELGIPYAKSYANFVMFDLHTAERADALVQNLLEKGVFIRGLKAFGLPSCLRVTVGLPEENQLFVECLKEVY